MSWAAGYIVLQLIEVSIFYHWRPDTPPPAGVGYYCTLGLFALNSFVFGGLSLVKVGQLGSWGQVCLAYLLAGAVLNTVLTMKSCGAAFYASLGPFALYFAVMPMLALLAEDGPSGLVAFDIGLGGAFIVVISVKLRRVWVASREAELKLIADDFAARAANEERLFQLAHHDGLTGLGNRSVLRSRLTELVGGEVRATLLMADLDGFKGINDTLGHSAGDEVLREVATRLSASVRPGDVVVRLGGDEFAMLLPGVADAAFAGQMAARVIAAVSEPLWAAGQAVNVGASIGIAFYPSDGAGVDELVSNADLALYKAKADGRNRSRLYEPSLRVAAVSKRAQEDALLWALEREEFLLFYQPTVRLPDGRTAGAEALLRWRHPEKGLLAPARFPASIEESRLAGQVGVWVLMTACRQAARWRMAGAGEFRVSVNLLDAHLRSGSLVADIDRALASTGLPPDCLDLEITVSTKLCDDEAIIGSLQALRSRGVGVAFDDYGTGYAPLSLLKAYPLSHVKIDQSFIRCLGESEADAAIVRGIVSMAHACGLRVIAEGVETQAQAELLRREGCDEGQGDLFGRPIGAAEFGRMLISGAPIAAGAPIAVRAPA